MTKRTSAPAEAPAGKPTERTSPNAKWESAPQTAAGTLERLSPEAFKLAELQLRKLFGRNVREARRRARLTQVQVADITGSTQPFIGAVERGEQNVKLATIVRLAYAVRTDPGALLLGDGSDNYSLETLVRLVAALNTYLQTTISEKGVGMPPAAVLTLIPKSLESVTSRRSRLPGNDT